MKKFIRGKNMRDVAARVLNWRLDFLTQEYKLNVTWINLLGVYGDDKPFYIGQGSKPANEDIAIAVKDMDRWEQSDDLESVKASAELARRAQISNAQTSAT